MSRNSCWTNWVISSQKSSIDWWQPKSLRRWFGKRYLQSELMAQSIRPNCLPSKCSDTLLAGSDRMRLWHLKDNHQRGERGVPISSRVNLSHLKVLNSQYLTSSNWTLSPLKLRRAGMKTEPLHSGLHPRPLRPFQFFATFASELDSFLLCPGVGSSHCMSRLPASARHGV